MLGLGLSLQKGVSAFNAGRALVSSYIRRVTDAGGVLQNTTCDAAAINELNQDRLLEPASWVLVPDGIKEDVVYAQKPSTGLGDLTFTRASDATYTDSTGVVRRSPYNLFQYSEMFTDASWTKLNSATTANVTTAPNGTFTADKLALIAGINPLANDGTGLSQWIAVNSGIYTYSIYLKAAERNIARWRDGGSTGQYLVVNLNDGTFTNGEPARFQNVQVTFVGNGWYRVQFTTGTITNPNVYPLRFGDTGQTGDGTSGGFIWGAQLVEGTSALDYFPTTNRQDVPRIDFRNADGTLSSCGRLLLEPQRTNSIRNSSIVGAVAGTPGTLPTNWGAATAGLTQTVVGLGVESGLQYVDLRFNGTASSSIVRINSETINQIASANGQTWASSAYMRRISGTYESSSIGFALRNSFGTGLGALTAANSLTTTLQRFVFVGTTNNASVAFVQPQIDFLVTIGQSYDFTIRIAAPQMELGAYATTWVPTTTAAVTRLADTATRSNIYTNGLISSAGGTWVIDLSNNLALTRDTASGIEIANTGFTQRIILFNTGGVSRLSVFLTTAGVAFTTTTSNVKLAIKWNGSTASVFANGVKVANNVTFTGLNMENLILSNGVPFYINQMLLAPTPLSDDQCEVLTSEGYGTYALLAQSLNCVLQ